MSAKFDRRNRNALKRVLVVDDEADIRELLDMTLARTIARCGYADYAVVDELFSITRPLGGG